MTTQDLMRVRPEIPGDAADPSHPFGWAQALRRDARGGEPEASGGLLAAQGFWAEIIPAAWGAGGRWRSPEGLFILTRRLAGRDAGLAARLIAPLTGLAALDIGGSVDQRGRAAAAALKGEGPGWAVYEPAPLATEAWRDGERWRISGRKPLASGGEALALVLARLEAAGPETLFLTKGGRAGPRRRFTGLKASPLAELALDGAPAEIVGLEGAGADVAARASAVAGLMAGALSLGALETALGLAKATAQGRAGGPHPQERAMLSEAMAAHWGLRLFATGALRVLRAAPGQAGFWSLVFQTRLQEAAPNIFAAARGTLGARALLADDPAGALMNKIGRDIEAARLMIASPAANLQALALRLEILASARARGRAQASWPRLKAALAPGDSGEPLRLEALRAAAPEDWVMESLPILTGMAGADLRLPQASRATLSASLRQGAASFAALEGARVALKRSAEEGYARAPELYDAGAGFARLYALAALGAVRLIDPESAPAEAAALAAAQLGGAPARGRAELREAVWGMWRPDAD